MSLDERKRGFLIMPFDPELRWLHEVIVRASVAKGVRTRRADDIFEPGSILQQILDDIDSADVVLAVCTGKNANVFFELGYAWVKHTPILVAEDTKDIPFDVAAFRTELYGRNIAGADKETLPFRLERAIDSVLNTPRPLPRGRVLTAPPRPKPAARLIARLESQGRGHRVLVTNAGAVDVHDVDLDSPQEATSFSLQKEDLPVDVLRPGETIRVPAAMTMGGGPGIFDLTISGRTGDGEPVNFQSKISF